MRDIRYSSVELRREVQRLASVGRKNGWHYECWHLCLGDGGAAIAAEFTAGGEKKTLFIAI